MMMKTSELTRVQLNWAVAQAEGDKVYRPRLGRPDDWDKEAYLADGSDDRWVVRVQNRNVARFVDWTYNPSGSWWEGGPIIEREGISVCCIGRDINGKLWTACAYDDPDLGEGDTCHSPLIAAMRCYVASKLGDEVEIPEELA
jgi:hypothetical protein